jgi:hypothetical protein
VSEAQNRLPAAVTSIEQQDNRFLIGLTLAYAKDWSMLVREVNIKRISEPSTAFEV